MYFSKMVFVGASVLMGCWAVIQATPALFPYATRLACRDQVTHTCGSTSGYGETTFTNENYPSSRAADAGTCLLRITPLNDNICQLRLDLDEFTLSQPNSEGVCNKDFLQVIAGSSNVPTICGDNAGQHMYVDVKPQFGTALINIDTAEAGAKWSIKVTQIACNSADRAPPGCLQYFTSTTGSFSSFNYDSNTGTTTRQLVDQVYGVCIQSQPGYCSVTYRQEDGDDFSLSDDLTALAPGIPPPALAGDACTSDYLLIPGAQLADPTVFTPPVTTADRFCGLSFPTVTSSLLPFNVFVVTDGFETGPNGTNPDINNVGFQISYRMNAC